jgi:hypothetical protein
LLTGSTDVQLRAALDGLPGIGKTELARQVVARLARSRKFPGGIYWFNAEHADLRMQWAQFAEDSGGPALPELDARARWAVRQVEQRAQQGDAILFVLDNVETWSPPPAPLPDLSAIRLLVTTRVRWLHNSFQPYEVSPLELTPARTLLHAIVGRELPDEDALLTALGGHVLSIELAATYLREYGTSPAEYLAQLAAGRCPGSSVADQTSYRATAEAAFRLLWQRFAPALRTAWVLAAQLPPVWFSGELAEAIGLDVERRRGLVQLHILERDDRGRHQMHRLLREFALAVEPQVISIRKAVIRRAQHLMHRLLRSPAVTEELDATSLREVVIQRATELLDSGDGTLTFERYRRDADCFEQLVADAVNSPSLLVFWRRVGADFTNSETCVPRAPSWSKHSRPTSRLTARIIRRLRVIATSSVRCSETSATCQQRACSTSKPSHPTSRPTATTTRLLRSAEATWPWYYKASATWRPRARSSNKRSRPTSRPTATTTPSWRFAAATSPHCSWSWATYQPHVYSSSKRSRPTSRPTATTTQPSRGTAAT